MRAPSRVRIEHAGSSRASPSQDGGGVPYRSSVSPCAQHDVSGQPSDASLSLVPLRHQRSASFIPGHISSFARPPSLVLWVTFSTSAWIFTREPFPPCAILSPRGQTRALAAPAVLTIMVSEGVFRGHADTRTPAVAASSAACANIVLDPLMMFAMGLGMSGWCTCHVVDNSSACSGSGYDRLVRAEAPQWQVQ